MRSIADARKNVALLAELDRERRWFWNDTQSVRMSAPAAEILAMWRAEFPEYGLVEAIDMLGVEEAARVYGDAVASIAREMARSLPRQTELRFGATA